MRSLVPFHCVPQMLSRRFLPVLAFALAGCHSMGPPLPPAVKPLEDSGLAVRYLPAVEAEAGSRLELVEVASGKVLADEASLFTADVVREIGPPGASRLISQVSLSGKTVVVWEGLSGAYSAAQVVLFSREGPAGAEAKWTAHRAFPPLQRARLQTIHARPMSVDDEYLYFTIDNWPVEKKRLASLEPVPDDYVPEKAKKEEKDKKEDEEMPQTAEPGNLPPSDPKSG